VHFAMLRPKQSSGRGSFSDAFRATPPWMDRVLSESELDVGVP
jgi:hypothetical protein